MENPRKIILGLMIKNEMKIIERCLESAIDHVDAICIMDTGSEDDTVNICKLYLEKTGKPYRIHIELFKNFGYNRTKTYEKACELCTELNWDKNTTYMLAIDADMKIVVCNDFAKYELTLPGYTIKQVNNSLIYYNIRLIRCDNSWKCIGSTHEYWQGGGHGNINDNLIFIDDKNDGGCKQNKFERDIILLKNDIEENNNNSRAYFYLAQSYKCINKYNEAIEYYKKRILFGGWYEEVWYSMYQLMECYNKTQNYEDMEYWGNKAFNYYNKRAEPLYFLTKYYRESGEHYKAYHYYNKGKNIPFPEKDVLFIEKDIYNGLFDYENTILSYYIYNKTKNEVQKEIVAYINNGKFNLHVVWSNLYYYIDIVKCNRIKIFFPDIREYSASSCSFITHKGMKIMNIRYVNYKITESGAYITKDNDSNNIIKTINASVRLDNNLYQDDDVNIMTEDKQQVYPATVLGLEDLRLFEHNNELYGLATAQEYNEARKYRMTLCKYDIYNKKIHDIQVIMPYTDTEHEKNWIYIPNDNNKMNFIYSWQPYRIGYVSNNKLDIYIEHNMPNIFSQMRGSSNVVEYNNKYWCITHIVRYSMQRVYYHILIQINKETLIPERYTFPFCFKSKNIEYCLGLEIINNIIKASVSFNDSNPEIIIMSMDDLYFIPI